ncbi:MAG: hypothetical protein MI802_08890 [Desulfobacterales bacterium]|nr:hypothetical protein [Desulfobacterales bacterium]
MCRRYTAVVISFFILIALVSGCGQDLPFEYKYLSATKVRIDYQGNSYHLDRFGPKQNTPFSYAFESDGDLDITIAGKTYDIDSPYDIDKPKSSKTKKAKKKKSSSKKRKK